MVDAMGTLLRTTQDENKGHNFAIFSQIRRKAYICADGVEDYTVKVVLTNDHGSNTVTFVRMKVTSESIPGLDQNLPNVHNGRYHHRMVGRRQQISSTLKAASPYALLPGTWY
ncbi:hypothetical protein N7G274_002339 [Stereocaulon virgatum]|uniref:Cadherin domain-containing protein n=1 Tax=Stereocaulon virgatum TaxID=373712 RepID=A0ABR4AKD5_9LECA